MRDIPAWLADVWALQDMLRRIERIPHFPDQYTLPTAAEFRTASQRVIDDLVFIEGLEEIKAGGAREEITARVQS